MKNKDFLRTVLVPNGTKGDWMSGRTWRFSERTAVSPQIDDYSLKANIYTPSHKNAFV